MAGNVIRVLLIEDNPTDAEIMQELLAKDKQSSFEVTQTDLLSTGLKYLSEKEVDLVILDLRLPDSRGLDTIKKVCDQSSTVPIVVLTASDDEDLALQAVQAGAQDYLVKGYIQVYSHLLGRSLRYAIERKRAEVEVLAANIRTETILSSITSILIGVGSNGLITHWNSVAEETFGLKGIDVVRKNIRECRIPWESERVMSALEKCQSSMQLTKLDDVVFKKINGNQGYLGIIITPLKSQGKEGAGFLIFGADITERKEAEEERSLLQKELAQAQKMETVGRFAGGIAHDFNNFLQVILGFALVIRSRYQNDAELLQDLAEISHAAESASEMVRKLLAFSRRQALLPKLFEINQSIRNMSRLIQQFVGEKIKVEMHLSQDPLFVKLDPTGLEQIIMNLASNAKDAMFEGGALTVKTARSVVDESFVETHSWAKGGDYIRLSIQDTGTGMEPEVAAHIFEPFFTTKQFGSGTGLGLAVVYGLVKQHDGLIDIDTAPGHGTAVHIYFPAQNAQTQPSSESLEKIAADAVFPSSTRTSAAIPEKKAVKILVVDDDASIRILCQRILKEAYQVGISTSAQEALSELKTNSYDILLTDLKMPGMDGLSLMQEAIKTNPALRLVAMTGHMTDEVTQKLKRSSLKYEFVRKPFTPLQLQEAITRIL